MSPQQRDTRRKRTETETFVIARTEQGYRVHSPKYPSFIYRVTGIPDSPECSCPDYEYHDKDPDWRCKHILAVLDKIEAPAEDGPEPPDYYDNEEREAIRADGEPARPPTPRKRTPRSSGNGSSQMLIKRSVSPDGRFDSLSVEFSCPVEKLPAGEIKERAEKILDLQAGIAQRFMARNGHGEEEEVEPDAESDGPVQAKMIDVAGMNTRSGRRLFINVQVNGETLKLFGTRKQLAEAVASAGHGDHDADISEGTQLDLPCRVTTKQSPDGRYTNIDRVFPAGRPRPVARGRR